MHGLFSTAGAKVAIFKDIAGLASTMMSPPVDALVTAQPVVRTGRGQTAQAQTATTAGPGAIHKVMKSMLLLY